MEAYEALTEQPPPNGNTAAARADYEARYAQAMTIIRFSVAEELDSRLIGIKDPATIWEILKRDLDGTTSQAGRNRLARSSTQYVRKPTNRSPITTHAYFKYRMQLNGTMQQNTDQILIMGRVRTGGIRKERAAARKKANIAPTAGWIITTRKNADAARRCRTVASMRAATASFASIAENPDT